VYSLPEMKHILPDLLVLAFCFIGWCLHQPKPLLHQHILQNKIPLSIPNFNQINPLSVGVSTNRNEAYTSRTVCFIGWRLRQPKPLLHQHILQNKIPLSIPNFNQINPLSVGVSTNRNEAYTSRTVCFIGWCLHQPKPLLHQHIFKTKSPCPSLISIK